jgi:hypothetical protein
MEMKICIELKRELDGVSELTYNNSFLCEAGDQIIVRNADDQLSFLCSIRDIARLIVLE